SGRESSHGPRLPVARRRTIRSALFDLTEFQFDGHGAPEDRNFHLEPRTLLVDVLDGAVERGEGPIADANLLADLERHRRLRPLHALLDLVQEALGFLHGDVHRLGRMLVLTEE